MEACCYRVYSLHQRQAVFHGSVSGDIFCQGCDDEDESALGLSHGDIVTVTPVVTAAGAFELEGDDDEVGVSASSATAIAAPSRSQQVTISTQLCELGRATSPRAAFWTISKNDSGRIEIAATVRTKGIYSKFRGMFQLCYDEEEEEMEEDGEDEHDARGRGSAMVPGSFVAAIQTCFGTFLSARKTGITANGRRNGTTEKFVFVPVGGRAEGV